MYDRLKAEQEAKDRESLRRRVEWRINNPEEATKWDEEINESWKNAVDYSSKANEFDGLY